MLTAIGIVNVTDPVGGITVFSSHHPWERVLMVTSCPREALSITAQCAGAFETIALFLALARVGNNMLARMPIMAITTSNSIRVNPFCAFFIYLLG